ncbi:hypothetical protein [Streptomyces cucumeris]|uniref:hypothetical protein n=1 Tax=Streptomyces cucumeris TaxID=2962890 RepID=UPI003D718D1F
MDQQSSSIRFWSELHELREAAGRPPLKTLSRLGQGPHTPREVADSTISGWLTGKAIPSADYTNYVLALVRYLHSASGRQWAEAVRDRWAALLAEARAEQNQLRGTRKDVASAPTPPPRAAPLQLSGRVRRHLYFTIGSSAGVKFNMIPPIATSYPSEALSEFLAALERIGVAQQLLDLIRTRADDLAAAPPGEQVAAVFAFAEAIDRVRDALREQSVDDEYDWFNLADLIARISLIVRGQWPEVPSSETESLRDALNVLAERLDFPASGRSAIQDFARMELPTPTLDEFTSAAIRLQELCYRLL